MNFKQKKNQIKRLQNIFKQSVTPFLEKGQEKINEFYQQLPLDRCFQNRSLSQGQICAKNLLQRIQIVQRYYENYLDTISRELSYCIKSKQQKFGFQGYRQCFALFETIMQKQFYKNLLLQQK